MMLIHVAFGAVVKKIRKEQKLTQRVLAEKADLSIDYIHDLEHGLKKPSLNVVESIAKAFEIKIYELVKQTEIFSEDGK